MANWSSALSLLQTASTAQTYSPFRSTFSTTSQNYDFSTDNRGRPVLPTMATFENTSDPASKLVVAGQLADVIEIQVNAATKTGLPNRVADMTAKCKEVLDAVKDVVDDLKSKDGSVPAGASDPNLEPYQKELARVLGTLRSNLAKISDLLPKAKKDVAAETDQEIQKLDIRGSVLATLADLEWESVQSKVDSSAARTDPHKVLDIYV